VRRNRRLIVLLSALAMVGACSSGEPPSETGTTGTTGTGSSGSTHTGTKTPCPFEDFGETATRVVQVQPLSASSPTELTERRQLPCVTSVIVNQGGAANVDFGSTATCQIIQDQPDPEKVARITTRDPKAALFRMAGGRAVCTMSESGQVIPLCGQGVLLISEPMQTMPACDPDPVFRVAAYAGSVQVVDPNGDMHTLVSGTQLVFSFETGEARIEGAQFNPPDEALFAQQAAALGLQPLLRKIPEVTWDGGPLMATDGEWSASPTPAFAYRWQGACSSLDVDADCTDITGATQSTYTPSEADCPAVRVVVTARNEQGSDDAASSPFDLDILGIDCASAGTTASTGSTGVS
jgi:hypothetical protein